MTRRWILLRGLMRERRHWEDFPDRFRQYFPQDELLLADLPGFGAEHGEPGPLSIAGITERLRLRWHPWLRQGPVHLLALSLGGMVAIDWASRHPRQVAGLVLLNTSLAGFSPFYQRLRPRAYWPLLKWLLWQRDPQAQEATILRLTSRRFATDPDLLARWAGYARELPASRRSTLCQLLAALRYRAPAQPPPVPTLVLNGLADRLVSPRCSRALAEAWRLPLRRHPDAGHDLTLDEPDWVCRQLADWLTEGRQADAT
ncbi:alpha/beta hydrolase [Zobellella denitrificans]|uniref:alpha/beta fold hydrolase n=1 Tax=Zobellella denitrificans TaxID=347534 RepID=UPI000B8C51FA|nr:alpha/beta hydrolase [Zobellella denitrificans]OXS16962.1 alpha/beta hydrolase [Zobellella denitrificans]